jgi:hypothetical protein
MHLCNALIIHSIDKLALGLADKLALGSRLRRAVCGQKGYWDSHVGIGLLGYLWGCQAVFALAYYLAWVCPFYRTDLPAVRWGWPLCGAATCRAA